MEQLVSYNTAFLAQELGFDIPVQDRYFKNGKLNGTDQKRFGGVSNWNHECFQDEYRKYVSAPTQSELKEWLRLNGINIDIISAYGDSMFNIYDIKNKRFLVSSLMGETWYNVNYEDYYNSPQDALEKALEMSLVIKNTI